MPNVITGGTFVFDNAPIGCVLPFLKNLTGCPEMPSGWIECDGSTISDDQSPFNGTTIPDLNGDNRFFRGNDTSGATGGESTHTLTAAEIPAHSHTVSYRTGTGTASMIGAANSTTATSSRSTSSVGSGSAHENKPPFYDVVYIMRYK